MAPRTRPACRIFVYSHRLRRAPTPFGGHSIRVCAALPCLSQVCAKLVTASPGETIFRSHQPSGLCVVLPSSTARLESPLVWVFICSSADPVRAVSATFKGSPPPDPHPPRAHARGIDRSARKGPRVRWHSKTPQPVRSAGGRQRPGGRAPPARKRARTVDFLPA